MDKQKNNWLTNSATVCLLAMVCCALWGSAFPSIKIGYKLFRIKSGDFQSQILFAGFRFFLAGILAVLIGSLVSRSILKPQKHSWGRIVKLCMFQTVIQYIMFYIGLAHASGMKSSIIEGAGVFVTILMASLVFKQELLTVPKVVGCILGLSGVVIVNMNGAGLSMDLSFLGEGFIFLSTIASAISSVMIKNYSKADNPVMLSGYQFILGGLVMIAFGLISGGRIHRVTADGLAVLGYLAFISAAAYSLWSVLLKYNPVSKVAVWGFTNPVFGVTLSMIFLHEEQKNFGLRIIAALSLVCIGIYIVNSEKPFTYIGLRKHIKNR